MAVVCALQTIPNQGTHAREDLFSVALILWAQAIALDEDGLGVVAQTVEQRQGEHGVLVDVADPVIVDFVACHQRGATLVAVADDLEQSVGAELVDRADSRSRRCTGAAA